MPFTQKQIEEATAEPCATLGVKAPNVGSLPAEHPPLKSFPWCNGLKTIFYRPREGA